MHDYPRSRQLMAQKRRWLGGKRSADPLALPFSVCSEEREGPLAASASLCPEVKSWEQTSVLLSDWLMGWHAPTAAARASRKLSFSPQISFCIPNPGNQGTMPGTTKSAVSAWEINSTNSRPQSNQSVYNSKRGRKTNTLASVYIF